MRVSVGVAVVLAFDDSALRCGPFEGLVSSGSHVPAAAVGESVVVWA